MRTGDLGMRPSMAVRHRCLAVSRPPRRQSRSLSGSQRALRTRGGTPGYPRKSAQCHVNAVFSAPLAPRGPPLRRPHALQSRQPVCSRRVAVPSRLSLPGADHRSRGSNGSMRTIAPTILAIGPLHGRQAPPLGRQRAARRQTAAQRPSEALPNLRRHPEAPPEPPSARQRRSQCHTRHRWLPRDSPRLLPNLEQQSDTGAPATTWYSATPRTYPHIHSATTPPPRTPPPLPPPFFSSLRVAARYLPSYSSDRNSP